MPTNLDDNTRRSPPPAAPSRNSKQRPKRTTRSMVPPPSAKRHRSMAPSPQLKPEPHFGTTLPQIDPDLDFRPANFVFIVTQSSITPHSEPMFSIIGAYPTLVDANNKVIELWEGEKQLWQGVAEEHTEEEGTIWWKAQDRWGNQMEVRAERKELASSGTGRQKQWGRDRPFRDENAVESAF